MLHTKDGGDEYVYEVDSHKLSIALGEVRRLVLIAFYGVLLLKYNLLTVLGHAD